MSWVEADMMDGANGKVPDKGPLSLSYKTWPGCKRTRVRRRMCDKLLLYRRLIANIYLHECGIGVHCFAMALIQIIGDHDFVAGSQ
jgi:hypothetical protein